MKFQSFDPATGSQVWEGTASDAADCRAAFARARAAFADWAEAASSERIGVARRFAALLTAEAEEMATLISRETGKLLWDSRGEVAAMIAKIEVSIAAQAERAGTRSTATAFGEAILRHRPHGIMAVLGPYNFPGHLPNGHITPALLAGNCVVFKPSEEAPATGERLVALWREAGAPPGVLEIVQGGRETGAALLECDIDGLLFTGSADAGRHFRAQFVDRPRVILALELGGNNPLVAWDGAPKAVSDIIVHSAFMTTGQRCSCARRLIVPEGPLGNEIVDALVAHAAGLGVGAWDADDRIFMGPLVSDRAANNARAGEAALLFAGGKSLLASARYENRTDAFMGPAIIDMTGIASPDREIFAPILQLWRVGSFEDALGVANDTSFGLSAGLISANETHWKQFRTVVRAGVVNWNRPTTGAASSMPFGGLGESGNHRPSAYYAADYCAHPVASFEASQIKSMPFPS